MNTQIAASSLEIDKKFYEKYQQILAETGESVNADLERCIVSMIEYNIPQASSGEGYRKNSSEVIFRESRPL